MTLRFTFTLDGEAAPTGAGAGDRTAKLETDERLPQIVIMLDDKPRIQGILPQRPWK